MPNTIDLYTPRTLWGVIEKNPPVKTFLRDTFFSNTVTYPTESVDFDMKKGGRQLAPFVNPRIGARVIANSGYSTKSYKAPMVAPAKVTTAGDLLTRMAGENPYSGMTPAARAVKKLAQDYRELEEVITRREEWMCASLLFTGTIPVLGDGVNETISFGFTNSVTITNNADKWSATTAPIYTQIETWYRTVQKNGYVNPNIMILGKNAWAGLRKNTEFQTLLDNRRFELANIEPKALPSGATWVGRINEFNLDLYTYTEYYLDDWTTPGTPTEMPLVPDDYVGMFSTEAQFSMLYGAHTYIPGNSEEFETVMGGRIPNSYVERNPDRRMITLASHPLPVPHEVDSWLIAKVC